MMYLSELPKLQKKKSWLTIHCIKNFAPRNAYYHPKIYVAIQGDKTEVNENVDMEKNVGEGLCALFRLISYLRFEWIL